MYKGKNVSIIICEIYVKNFVSSQVYTLSSNYDQIYEYCKMTENRLNIIKKGNKTECIFLEDFKEIEVYMLLRKMLKHKFRRENLFSSSLACKSAKVKSQHQLVYTN